MKHAPASPKALHDGPYVIRKGGDFYRPNRQGYTAHILAAGIYTQAEALEEMADRAGEVTALPLTLYRDEIELASRLANEKLLALGCMPIAGSTALGQIEARHAQDDLWFTGGLHDPNGYVAMAHKDRGALLRAAKCHGGSDALLKVQVCTRPSAHGGQCNGWHRDDCHPVAP